MSFIQKGLKICSYQIRTSSEINATGLSKLHTTYPGELFGESCSFEVR